MILYVNSAFLCRVDNCVIVNVRPEKSANRRLSHAASVVVVVVVDVDVEVVVVVDVVVLDVVVDAVDVVVVVLGPSQILVKIPEYAPAPHALPHATS